MLQCLPVLELYQDVPSTSQENVECEIDIENIYDDIDYIIFFNKMFELLDDRNNTDCLRNVLKHLAKSDLVNNEEFQVQFQKFVLKILSKFKKGHIDFHLVLETLSIYENFSIAKIFSKNDTGIISMILVLTVYKRKFELFSCGCIQRFLVQLYQSENRTRFCKLIDDLIKGKGKISKYAYLFDLEQLSPSNCFDLCTEFYRELINCGVLEKNGDELWNLRITHLIILFDSIKETDFEASSKSLSNFINSLNQRQKVLPKNMKKPIKQLFNKVFEFIEKNDYYGNCVVNEENLEKIGNEILNNEKYSMKAMGPLELLMTIQKTFEIDSSILDDVVAKRLILSAEKFGIQLLYSISLAVHQEDLSSFSLILNFIEENFEKGTKNQKDIMLFVVDLIIIIGKSKENVQALCENKRFKQKILLASSQSSEFYIIKYIDIFDSKEFEDFCKIRITDLNSISEPNWNILIRKIANFTFYCKSDKIWEYVMKNAENKTNCQFIKNQLNIISETLNIRKRFNEIVSVLKNDYSDDSKNLPPPILLISFIQTILEIEDKKYLPKNWMASLLPLAILAYCIHYDEYEDKIRRIFKAIYEFLTEKSAENDDPLILFAEIIIQKQSDILSWKRFDEKWPKGETFGKVFGLLIDSNEGEKRKKRVAHIISIMFKNSSVEIQSNGDKQGSNAFCKLATVFEKSLKTEKDKIENSILKNMISGYAKCSCNGNIIFLRSRIFNILKFVKNTNIELLKEFGEILSENQELCKKMKSSEKDYMELSEFLGW
ncbi:unnamed protein product [Caenorhabditis angaria]|uniref:Uncharacterized protein n=1 Tax=Caenorhabditis angaria TaxID=860376 RepID=A0A9P1I8T1_9PELO|nr:unnamed protein product [Caenorhabditis angaria]